MKDEGDRADGWPAMPTPAVLDAAKACEDATSALPSPNMNGTGQPLGDGDISEAKVEQLLALGAELDDLDFKEFLDRGEKTPPRVNTRS